MGVGDARVAVAGPVPILEELGGVDEPVTLAQAARVVDTDGTRGSRRIAGLGPGPP
jgi:hypothetical protein